MLAKYLIADNIPPLKPGDSGEKALQWMHELAVHQLPVVENGKLLNLIAMEDVINTNDFSRPIQDYRTSYAHPFVYETTHLLEVIKLCNKLKISVIPVLDDEEHYVGLVTADDVLRALSAFSSLNDEGSIIELEIALKDYSLSEIARIAEGNETKILSCFTNIRQDVAKVDVTLKLNTNDLSVLVAAFERYEYEVKGVYHETGYTEDLKDRYDSFMRYLNV